MKKDRTWLRNGSRGRKVGPRQSTQDGGNQEGGKGAAVTPSGNFLSALTQLGRVRGPDSPTNRCSETHWCGCCSTTHTRLALPKASSGQESALHQREARLKSCRHSWREVGVSWHPTPASHAPGGEPLTPLACRQERSWDSGWEIAPISDG